MAYWKALPRASPSRWRGRWRDFRRCRRMGASAMGLRRDSSCRALIRCWREVAKIPRDGGYFVHTYSSENVAEIGNVEALSGARNVITPAACAAPEGSARRACAPACMPTRKSAPSWRPPAHAWRTAWSSNPQARQRHRRLADLGRGRCARVDRRRWGAVRQPPKWTERCTAALIRRSSDTGRRGRRPPKRVLRAATARRGRGDRHR